MQRNNVGMSQLANHPGFAKESFACFANCQLGTKKFYCQLPPDHRVKSAHYPAGGADAKSFEQLVTSDLHWGDLPFLACNLQLAASNANEAKVPKNDKPRY
jgi:hypothetical protein